MSLLSFSCFYDTCSKAGEVVAEGAGLSSSSSEGPSASCSSGLSPTSACSTSHDLARVQESLLAGERLAGMGIIKLRERRGKVGGGRLKTRTQTRLRPGQPSTIRTTTAGIREVGS